LSTKRLVSELVDSEMFCYRKVRLPTEPQKDPKTVPALLVITEASSNCDLREHNIGLLIAIQCLAGRIKPHYPVRDNSNVYSQINLISSETDWIFSKSYYE